MHAWTCAVRCATSSLPGAPEPELKIQPVLLDGDTATAAAAAAADSNSQLQAHLKGRRLIRGRSGGGGRRGRRREEAVDDRVGGGDHRAAAGPVLRRREVEVGKRSSAVLVVVRGGQAAGARKGRRVRRRAALPEPGPVPPVDVHVAAQRLRRPELPPAVAAGVAGRRHWRRPREAAGAQLAEVVARQRRRPRRQRLDAAAVVSAALHCWWPAGGVV